MKYISNKIQQGISSNQLIILVSIFLITFLNITFFSNIIQVYPVNIKNISFLISLTWGFTAATAFILSLACTRYTIKPILIIILIISSFTGYFMDSYHAVIDESMIQNVMHTDINESLDLFSFTLVLYVIFLGITPSWLVYKSKLIFQRKWLELISRLKFTAIILISIISVILIFSDYYYSFYREHKPLRYYSNPSYYIYSAVKYIKTSFKSASLPFKQIGLDATINPSSPTKLVIFVVGETARANRFSLNGYQKITNPQLAKENIINFPNFWSCGTSTAVSVPCLFSKYSSDTYTKEKGLSTENALDILKHAGVSLLWKDNNSSSLGVADRIPYINYKSSKNNPICNDECRDEGMLVNLQKYINEHQNKNTFIILHQMGNHGPAYYKRYPKEFEKFSPICKTNQLEDCSKESLDNAYDNAILYTDYFLAKIISLLKKNSLKQQTALFYVSDHGESLGEKRIYLHGLPNFVAPDNQRHVPAIFWSSENFTGINKNILLKNKQEKYSHDYIFHSILGLMQVNTSEYNEQLDIFSSANQTKPQ